MLIEFSVANYRSFKEQVTFSMVAANITAKDENIDTTNVLTVDNHLKLLKSAAIYGANASGKSNLAKALGFMKSFMINSSRETQSIDKIDVEPFRLSTQTEEQPSFFELVFLLSGKKYRYGFEVNTDKVVSEWLFYVPNARETRLFKREDNEIIVSRTYKAGGIKEKTRQNALFLSVSAQFNVEMAEKILNWLKNLNIISGLYDNNLRYTIKNYLSKEENKEKFLGLMKKLDLGIHEFTVQERDITSKLFPELIPNQFKSSPITEISILTSHQKFNSEGHRTSMEVFKLDEHESEGTQKIFALAGSLLDTLEQGKILIIDEFDARLHPLISLAIVKLFNSNETNPNNAQLIFMTHDTNLLSNKIFRRDQIWFTEKNRQEATNLYSLAEYKIRNDASFESDYIKGKYGAIPYLKNLDNLIDSNVEKKS